MVDIGLDRMKEYLATAIECERNAFAWDETVKDTNIKLNNIAKEEQQLKNERAAAELCLNELDEKYDQIYKKFKSNITKTIISIIMLIASLIGFGISYIIPIVIPFILLGGITFISIFPPIVFIGPIILLLPLILMIVSIVLFARSQLFLYKYNYSKSNIKKMKDNEYDQSLLCLDTANKKISALNKRKAEIIAVQKECKSTYVDTTNTRKKIYDENILHPNYQNFVAVCRMYEYIDTGMCLTVNGPDGLAATYEKELKINQIISAVKSINDVLKVQVQLLQNIDQKQSFLCYQAEIARKQREDIKGKLNDNLNAINELSREQRRTNEQLRNTNEQLSRIEYNSRTYY